MKWILVYIALSYHGHPIATEEGRFDTMNECFAVREQLVEQLGDPVNYQAICIPHDPLDKYTQ